MIFQMYLLKKKRFFFRDLCFSPTICELIFHFFPNAFHIMWYTNKFYIIESCSVASNFY